MPKVFRFSLTLTLYAVVLGWSQLAHAWLSLAVTGDAAVVEVQRDGRATVTHDVLLRVRGGPLQHLSLTGVDTDAVPLGDATLTSARSGEAAGPPMLVNTEYDGEQAHFQLTLKKGVRSGSYLLRFSYQTDLKQHGKLIATADGAVIRWPGLLFDDGIDSMQTTFVLPKGERPPHLPGASNEHTAGMVATGEGVFLSELMQTGTSERLQLTRPHVARGERVTWQVAMDAERFDQLPNARPDALASSASAVARTTPQASPPRSSSHTAWFWCAFGGLMLSLLVFIKHRQGHTAFLVPMRTSLRLTAIFSSMSGSLACALVFESAGLAGTGLFIAMSLMLQRPVREPLAPRGPGRWKSVDLERIEAVGAVTSRKIRWLDAGSGTGFALFVACAVALTVVGLRLLGQSPYHSAMTLVYSTALVPLFFTLGATGQRSLLEEQCEFLTRLARRLQRRSTLTTEAIGRFSLDAERPDDLRLRLVLPNALDGLVSFEVGLGFVDTTLRRLLVPALVVRVREDSRAHAALPRDGHWSRGRTPEERVVVIRSPLPLISSCIETLQQTAMALQQRPPARAAERSARQSAARHPRRGAGSSATTLKRATCSPPGHAIR